jgi:MFS family permease
LATAIADAVGGSSQTIWLSQAIAILTTVLSPPSAQAADYWGRKWILVGSSLVIFAGGMITARCTSMGMAIAGQVLCGVGFGGQPLLYTVVSEILPRRARPAAQGVLMCSIALAGIIGLPMGSILVKRYHDGFRIYYYIASGLMGSSAIICALVYRPPPRATQKSWTLREKLNQLDWVGYFLLVTGLVLFSIALTWSQNPYSWSNAHILVPFILGLFLLCGLAVYEVKFKRDGIFHHDMFKKDRNLAICLFCIFVEGMALFASNEFFGLEVGTLWETDPVWISMRFNITFLTQLVGSICISFYASFSRDIRGPIILSFCCFTIFYSECSSPICKVLLCNEKLILVLSSSIDGDIDAIQLRGNLGIPRLSRPRPEPLPHLPYSNSTV